MGEILLAALVSTSTVYREAALRWQGVAELRQHKIEYQRDMWEQCEDRAKAWQNIAENKPSIVEKESIPDWIWPAFAVGIIGAFVAGAASQ